MEKTPILVSYKYKTIEDKYGDLVCEVTEFMDKYLLYKSDNGWYKTYLYNDIGVFSKSGYLQLAFRVPRSN